MWRGIVAMAHADGIVTPQEISFIHDYAKEIPFNEEELEIFMQDFQTPQDAYEMFARMTDPQDRKDFFILARALSWCDGDYAAQEKHIIHCLEKLDLTDDDKKLLDESRHEMEELDLDYHQWDRSARGKKGIFGFLARSKSEKVSV